MILPNYFVFRQPHANISHSGDYMPIVNWYCAVLKTIISKSYSKRSRFGVSSSKYPFEEGQTSISKFRK